MHISIYMLNDPRTGSPVYVGQTRKDPADRLKSHMKDAHTRCHTPLGQYLRVLGEVGEAPEVEVVEEIDAENYDGVEARKRDVARRLAAAGHTILNDMPLAA